MSKFEEKTWIFKGVSAKIWRIPGESASKKWIPSTWGVGVQQSFSGKA